MVGYTADNLLVRYFGGLRQLRYQGSKEPNVRILNLDIYEIGSNWRISKVRNSSTEYKSRKVAILYESRQGRVRLFTNRNIELV